MHLWILNPIQRNRRSPNSGLLLRGPHSSLFGHVKHSTSDWSEVTMTLDFHSNDSDLSVLAWNLCYHLFQVPLASWCILVPPSLRLSWASLHFFLVLSVERNSSLQRLEKIFTRSWANFHLFRGLNATSERETTVLLTAPSKNVSVSAQESVPSDECGREFISPSTYLIAVCSS